MKWTPLLLLWLVSPAFSGELRVGAAAVSITPPTGTPMAGYYSDRFSEAVRDDLFAKAIVLENDGTRAALVALDLISTTRPLVEEARREIERTTGIHGSDIMISATHTHTGPSLKSQGAREGVLGGPNDLVTTYSDGLPARIAEAVRLAESRLAPSTARAGHGTEATIAHNRRFHMKDGTVGWNPGLLNPNILKPAGTIDPDVAILAFERSNHAPVATYVNYAVHLDNVGGRKISADLPGTLSRLLAEVKGPEMVTLYTSGCCGDINQLDVHWGEKQQSPEFSARMGIILAAEVLKTWPSLKPIDASAIRVKSETVKLPLPKLAPGAVETARERVARLKASASKSPTFLETVAAYKVLDVEARNGKPIEVEVQVIALGNDVAWVSLPGEIFVELGLAIKQDSPFPHTLIAELANGSIGYIPSRRAYAQGNYEVVSARCAEGSGEMLVDAAVKLLKALYTATPKDIKR